MSKEETQEQPVEQKSEMKKVTPKKDFVLHFNDVHIELKKGESVEVPTMFLQNLKTEKVIK